MPSRCFFRPPAPPLLRGCFAAFLLGLLLFVRPLPARAQPAHPTPATVLRIHARSIDATVAALRSYLPVPLKPEPALESLLGPLGSSVQLGAPIDLLVALDTQSPDSPALPLWVVAMSVRSADEVRKLVSSSGLAIDSQGLWSRFQSKSRGDTWHCLLGPGPVGAARLACGLNERSRDELAGYSITQPALRTSADLRAELYVDTLVQTYDGLLQRGLQLLGVLVPQKLQLGQAGFDRALTDLTQAVVGQLAATSRDLRRIALDLSLNNSGAEGQLTYELVGQSSWWGQADALSLAQPPAPAPALFWGLRKDAGAASFSSADPRFARQILTLLPPLLDGFLSHDGLPPADRQAVLDLVKGLSLPDGSLTTVFAEVPAPPSAASPASPAPSTPERWFGGASYLFASEGRSGLSTDFLRRAATAYKRPGVQAYLRSKWKAIARTEPLPVLRLQPAAKSLGPGATLFTLTVTLPASLERATAGRATAGGAAAKAAAQPWVLHLLSVPQGERTWLAVGSDPSLLTSQLAAQLSLPSDGTLAKRPGLEALQQPGLRSGGFTSLTSLARYLESGLAMSRLRLPSGRSDKATLSDLRQLFNMIPHHGETTLVYTSRVRRGAGAGSSGPLTGELTLQVPRTAIEDLVALVMHLAL